MGVWSRAARELRFLRGLRRVFTRIQSIDHASHDLVCDDWERAVDRWPDHVAGRVRGPNNTKVFPALLSAYSQNGRKTDILLVREKDDASWEVLSKGCITRRLRISDELQVDLHNGNTAKFICSGNVMDIIWKYGYMPLPPYMKRLPDESDKITYQTVFAKEEGSIAAPTAGLHFTDTLLNDITKREIRIREITLHVGIGTFKPIRTESVDEHSMDAESFEIDKGLISEQ